jgi:hypothetical protein
VSLSRASTLLRLLAGALTLAAPAASARAASGDVCPLGYEAASGPLAGGTGPADFGAIPEACPATDVAMRARGALLIASTMPDYYGSILTSAMLRGRYRLSERSSLSLAVDALNYRYVNNGGLSATGASFGPATLAYHHVVWLGDRTASSLYARLLLPVDTARQGGVRTGIELGGSFRRRAGSRVVFDGGLAVTAATDVVGGQAHVQLEPVALGEAWYSFRPAIAVFAGASVHVEATPDWHLISAVPRLGARFALRRRFWFAVLAEVPVAGADRTDVVASVFLGLVPG